MICKAVRSILLYPAVLTFVLLFAATSGASERPHIVVDAESGNILSQHKANDRWHPASLTKLMTAYVTFRAIRNNEIGNGSPVVISNAAIRQPPGRMGYKQGVRLRVDTALKITIVKSANDVSHALAEAVAGSLDAFVGRMNAEAARLGMVNTRFANANGLHNTNQYTSARDMALLSVRLLRDFPEYGYMFAAAAIKTPANTHYSYNLLLERFAGANGMKTGFVCASGYNMVASARQGQTTLVAIVMGRSSQTERAVAAAKLLQEGFGNPGQVTGSVYSQVSPSTDKPRNMRPVLCTEEARKARYDPGAGNAKIESAYLQPRTRSGRILEITVGGIDADPSDAYLSRNFKVTKNIPVPVKRPEPDTATGQKTFTAIGATPVDKIPLPTPSPR